LGGAAQPQANAQVLGSYELLLPDLATQIKNGSTIDAYDSLIENNEKRIKVLEEMAQRLYTEWFVKFKFPGHEKVKMVDSGTEYGMIPEGWEVKRFGDKAKINQLSLNTKTPPLFINYIDIASVSTGEIDKIQHLKFEDAPSRARRIVKNGDIIWST